MELYAVAEVVALIVTGIFTMQYWVWTKTMKINVAFNVWVWMPFNLGYDYDLYDKDVYGPSVIR